MNSFRHVYRATSVGVAAVAGLALASGCCTKSYKTASYHKQESYAVAETPPAAAPTPTGRTEGGAGTMVVPLYEEKINVGKREVETGSVRLKKIVKTETVNQPIELRHEELVIDRESGNAAAQGNKVLDQPFQGGETVIRLKSEVPVVEKQTTTSGQVVVQTRSSSIQTNIQGEIRREDIDIDRKGENVIIGQNVQGSAQPGAAVGAAETSGGQTTGASASVQAGVITDPAMLSASSDASQWSGKQVQFSGVKVRRVIGDKVVVLDGGNGQQIYCYNKDQSATCKTGDLVNVKGTIKTSADSSVGDAAQQLASAPFYIQADQIEVSNK